MNPSHRRFCYWSGLFNIAANLGNLLLFARVLPAWVISVVIFMIAFGVAQILISQFGRTAT